MLRSSSSRGFGGYTSSSSRDLVDGYAGGYTKTSSDPHWVTMESPTGKRAKSGDLRRMIRQSQSCNIAIEGLFLNNESERSTKTTSTADTTSAAEEDSLCCVLPRKPTLPFGTPLSDVTTLIDLDGDDSTNNEGDDILSPAEAKDPMERYRPVRTPRRSRSFGIVGGGASGSGHSNGNGNDGRGGPFRGNLRLSLRRGLSARFNR